MLRNPLPSRKTILLDLSTLLLLSLFCLHGCHAQGITHLVVPPTPCEVPSLNIPPDGGSVTACINGVSLPIARTAQYRRHGPAVLNDLAFTPGATGTLPQETLCSKTFHTGTVRNVTEATKQAACRAYGIARADCTGQKYEIDHLISLELGGSNDIKNLWPQPYFPKPGAKEKDVVENWLHRQVCSGKVSLADAQHQISTDWYAVYLAVPTANGGGAK